MMAIILAGILTLSMVASVAPIGFLINSTQTSGSNVTCSNPTMANADARQQIEEQILKTTVRISIETWVVKANESGNEVEPGYEIEFSERHTTIKDDRYLVTHNHFSMPLSIRPREGEPEAYGIVTLFNSNGEQVFKGLLSNFELVWDDPETLVIAHKENGFFEKLAFISAEFKDWSSVTWAVGMEVAQVDWDGATTRVDWATIQEVKVEDEVPWLVLSDDVTIGASGGGIFWQDIHVANNWLLMRQIDESGALSFVTKVALNSAQVAKEGSNNTLWRYEKWEQQRFKVNCGARHPRIGPHF
jgi:hypothetical protein